ncbi:thioredoxin-like protein [Fusarium flagelliforme]|uniref:thioredoxin-like protein n=1 Tax=Fusarium flagelliforme TaxID=2675880 RepID=UPI001E8D9E07|nr:thioredoxin-like protein [Fusarium flagelliforme]KAH7173939.1 thioredoxin-like protein [Fusarium flagelliforme]
MGVIEIRSMDEYNQLLKSHRTVVINASAEGYGPCKAMSPVFETSAAENESDEDKVAFVKFDTDLIPDLAGELEIRSVPAFFVFESGELVDKMFGANPLGLNKLVQEAVERSKGE